MPNVTSVWDFSPGDVLSAAKLDDVNCGIHVFSGTATRDAAYGGSGERTLAEGEFAYLADSDTTQYYDGSAWQTLGRTPGLEYITSSAFSTAATVSLPANTFSSTYDHYRVIFVATVFSAAASLTMRMRASGSDDTNASYEYSIVGYDTGGTLNGIQGSGQTSAIVSYALTSGVALSMDIYNPKASQNTRFILNSFGKASGSTNPSPQIGGGSFAATTSFDALSFISASNMTGRYMVYGYVQ